MIMANEINTLTRQYRERLMYPPDPFEDNRKKGVFTNFNVMEINYEHDNVYVEATHNSNGNKVRFEGDAIICTASVGVLKAGYMKFNPPLPPWKMQALDKIEMGNYVKIFCMFKAKFWGNHEYIYIADHQRGKYPQWMPEAKQGKYFVMFTVVVGDEANRVEKAPKE